jgi:hypothetical protein
MSINCHEILFTRNSATHEPPFIFSVPGTLNTHNSVNVTSRMHVNITFFIQNELVNHLHQFTHFFSGHSVYKRIWDFKCVHASYEVSIQDSTAVKWTICYWLFWLCKTNIQVICLSPRLHKNSRYVILVTTYLIYIYFWYLNVAPLPPANPSLTHKYVPICDLSLSLSLSHTHTHTHTAQTLT